MEVGGEALLARHLRYLEGHGVQRVVLNLYHLADRIREWVDRYGGPLEVVCVEEPALLGTAGGVRNALEQLRPGPFLVLYGDILLDEGIDHLAVTHRRRRAAATIAVHAADDVEGKGVVELGPEDRVIGFVEKPQEGSAERAWINSGIYLLEEQFVADLPLGVPLDFGKQVLPAAVARGERVYAARLEHSVLDLGTPRALEIGRRLVS